MPLTLTPWASDSFQRANEDPLNGSLWGAVSGSGTLEVLNDACSSDNGNLNTEIFHTGAPNDQFAQFKVAAFSTATVGSVLRADPAGAQNFYGLHLGGGGSPRIQVIVGGAINNLLVFSTSVNVGDVWTLAAVGTTFYALQNGAQVASVTDSTYSSGVTGLRMNYASTPSDSNVTNFVMGSSTGLLQPKPVFQGNGNAGDLVPIQTVRSGNYTVSSTEVAQGYTNPIAVLFHNPFEDTNYTCQINVEQIFGIKAPKPIARVAQFQRMQDMVTGMSQGVIVVVELPTGSTVGDLLVLHVTAVYDYPSNNH